MVRSVRDARERGVLVAEPMFDRLTKAGVAWDHGRVDEADTIIWCIGFRPPLSHLAPLRLRNTNGHITTKGTHAEGEPRLHLLGYGHPDRRGTTRPRHGRRNPRPAAAMMSPRSPRSPRTAHHNDPRFHRPFVSATRELHPPAQSTPRLEPREALPVLARR
jgi:putative flavoprotein involved in K+ transport